MLAMATGMHAHAHKAVNERSHVYVHVHVCFKAYLLSSILCYGSSTFDSHDPITSVPRAVGRFDNCAPVVWIGNNIVNCAEAPVDEAADLHSLDNNGNLDGDGDAAALSHSHTKARPSIRRRQRGFSAPDPRQATLILSGLWASSHSFSGTLDDPHPRSYRAGSSAASCSCARANAGFIDPSGCPSQMRPTSVNLFCYARAGWHFLIQWQAVQRAKRSPTVFAIGRLYRCSLELLATISYHVPLALGQCSSLGLDIVLLLLRCDHRNPGATRICLGLAQFGMPTCDTYVRAVHMHMSILLWVLAIQRMAR
ncbi:hypothetical protein EVG20_g5224 [Dentipellis fragilis]|uniref:Uncharacterized protein n=1 Tax=Dentipellis fragilis TaxID=205917 RepID=A0A4Y9YXL6_9AGAM|nr:hypothetical protein EVG20_g5224 [Dentipellis fragilis]